MYDKQVPRGPGGVCPFVPRSHLGFTNSLLQRVRNHFIIRLKQFLPLLITAIFEVHQYTALHLGGLFRGIAASHTPAIDLKLLRFQDDFDWFSRFSLLRLSDSNGH